ncbi:MAG: ATP-binding protein, partial [Mariniphaga sp.]|nr:ATP-binding protein [Mariniphaga sp.]
MGKALDNSQKLILNSEIGHLELLRKFLKKTFKEREICRSKFNRLLLCISEGVSNAIIHGNKNNINKSVSLDVEIKSNEATVIIEDEGFGFDFNDQPNPTTQENLKKEKGRGLFIIKAYAKEIDFKNNGSILRIKFDLS